MDNFDLPAVVADDNCLQVLYIWRNCDRSNRQWGGKPIDHFVVACTPKAADRLIEPYVTLGRDCFQSDRSKSSFQHEGIEYFQVARDLSSVHRIDWYYAIDHQWRGYNPFVELPDLRLVSSLTELTALQIPKRDFET